MMSQADIAWLILQLLSETRTYRGTVFECGDLEPAERIRYARGLMMALPEHERRGVETAFERIQTFISVAEIMAYLSTHPETGGMQ
jgi:hypothetical protein